MLITTANMIGIKVDHIREIMHDHKIGERALAEAMEISRGSLRGYFKTKQMPPFLVWRMGRILEAIPSSLVSGNTVWMRIGVSVPITNEELFRLLEESKIPSQSGRGYWFDDVDLDEDTAAEFLRRAVADGESYIPGCSFDKF